MSQNRTLASLSNDWLTSTQFIDVSAKTLAQRLIEVTKMGGGLVPEDEAISFYGLNQMVGVLRNRFTENEPLPQIGSTVVEIYRETLREQHQFLVWYTFLIICRELRHLQNAHSNLKGPKFTQEFANFFHHLIDSHNEDSLNSWLAQVPDQPLAMFVDQITQAFSVKSWWSHSFGGTKWAKISRALQSYFEGKTSAEAFVDTAYTLAHNGGPMFNKSMFYQTYTNKLIMVLDVQRSGQICEAVIEKHLNGSIKNLVTKFKDELGGIGDYVDWFAVEKLGSLGQYPTLKAKQVKLWGGPKPEPTLVGGKPVIFTGEFEVLPGQTVKIFERMKAA